MTEDNTPIEEQRLKDALLNFVHGQIWAYITVNQPYKVNQIFDDFRQFHNLSEREWPYKRLYDKLANYESSLGLRRPRVS